MITHLLSPPTANRLADILKEKVCTLIKAIHYRTLGFYNMMTLWWQITDCICPVGAGGRVTDAACILIAAGAGGGGASELDINLSNLIVF